VPDAGTRPDATPAADAEPACDAGATCEPPPATEPLRIISWNVFFKNSRSNFEDALAEFEAREIDIVGFQELSSNGKPDALVEATGCPSCFYDVWKPGAPGEGGNVSIMWRRDRFSVAENRSGPMQYAVRVHGREDVEDGAGGTRTTTKYITYVLLKDAWTGQSLWVMNAHALPSVEGRCGHPSQRERRLELYELMMNTLADRIQTKAKPVFVTGDFNVNYRCDRNVRHAQFPWSTLNALEPPVKSNWQWHEEAGRSLPQVGTHNPHEGGRRLIDYVFAKEHPLVSYRGSQIWQHRRFGSDHAPVRATYRLARE
jgi:exonuclease III